MKIFTIATLLLLLTVSFAATAEKSALEQLFEQQQYDAFLQQAQQQAAENNAEALFLLGKAYPISAVASRKTMPPPANTMNKPEP
ncbi:hypothetical protein ACRN9L_18675 [Shewanella oncorhynchi]|uniref:hypothetical protein n=1 Tax=Shewanella oncorhynchi TaxID=2726434 RepID=UPI003D7A1BED